MLFIFVFLTLLSFRGDYCAERELWGIDRKLIFIAAHQESTPDYIINQLIGRYKAFAKIHNRSKFSQSAQRMIGNLYSLRKNYSQARLEFQKAVGPDNELSAQAEFAIAKTYELEDRWDKALLTYRDIIQYYPDTNFGFSVPIYLTDHLVTSGNQKDYTDRAYADALSFYQMIAIKNPKSKLEYNALKMVALCQLNLKDWSGTVKTMGDLILKYPRGKSIQEAVSAINMLCVTKLHDYDLGINIYGQFIQKYPDHPANPYLSKMIKNLQELNKRKLIVQTVSKTATK